MDIAAAIAALLAALAAVILGKRKTSTPDPVEVPPEVDTPPEPEPVEEPVPDPSPDSSPDPDPEPEPEPVETPEPEDPDFEPTPVPEPVPEPEPEPTPVVTKPTPVDRWKASDWDDATAREFLLKMGYTGDSAGTRAFQRASTWGAKLAEDAKFGALTTAHAKQARAAGYKLASNFTAAELSCPCGGKYAGCRVHYVHRDVVVILQYIRTHVVKGPLEVLVAYRCAEHNRRIGGRVSPPSAHVYGKAADFPTRHQIRPTTLKARALDGSIRELRGIGFKRYNGWACHIDTTEAKPLIFGEGTGSVAAK